MNQEQENVIRRRGTLPLERVISFPLSEVDAVMLYYLKSRYSSVVKYPRQLRRKQLSSGSIRYEMLTSTNRPLVAFEISTVSDLEGNLLTYLTIMMFQLPLYDMEHDREVLLDLKHDLEVVLGMSLDMFVAFLHDRQKRMLELAQKEIDLSSEVYDFTTDGVIQILGKLLSSDTPKNRGGGQSRAYNDRARARVAAGEPREAVYRDWLKERGDNPDDPDDRADGRDAFRKVLARKPKGQKGRTDAA
jgi:hypothetical protein